MGFGLLRQPQCQCQCQCQLLAPTGNFKPPMLLVLLLKGPARSDSGSVGVSMGPRRPSHPGHCGTVTGIHGTNGTQAPNPTEPPCESARLIVSLESGPVSGSGSSRRAAGHWQYRGPRCQWAASRHWQPGPTGPGSDPTPAQDRSWPLAGSGCRPGPPAVARPGASASASYQARLRLRLGVRLLGILSHYHSAKICGHESHRAAWATSEVSTGLHLATVLL